VPCDLNPETRAFIGISCLWLKPLSYLPPLRPLRETFPSASSRGRLLHPYVAGLELGKNVPDKNICFYAKWQPVLVVRDPAAAAFEALVGF
jgi:hypothetical protein